MTCKQCKHMTVCMVQVDGLRQVFDPNYDGEHIRCGILIRGCSHGNSKWLLSLKMPNYPKRIEK